MDLRLTAAIITGKLIAFIIKLTGGGATAAPGLYALKIDPNLVKKLTKPIKHGSIIVSGTNGKTTTARLISDIATTKYQIIANRQGSNLLRGIASTLISQSSLRGKITSTLAIWEIDEATVTEAIENTHPQIVLLLNLFRDQLDRYGEVDSVRARWQKTLAKLPASTTLILNADDPGVSFLAKEFKGEVFYFGVNDQKINLPQITHTADISHCLNCGATLKYSTVLSGHLGHYQCPNCRLKRPTPDISASNINFSTDFSTSLKLTHHSSLSTLHYPLPGLYNVYNILAATACATALGIDNSTIKAKISSFSAAFGRFQKVSVEGIQAMIFLIKNPTGANEVLRTLAQKDELHLLAILNDNIADGRDVSWVWDTNWEILAKKINTISIGGTRAWDLATRFKYAGFEVSKNNVYEDISDSISSTVKNLHTKDTLIILPTYTAMLEVQKTLSKMGSTKWHKQ